MFTVNLVHAMECLFRITPGNTLIEHKLPLPPSVSKPPLIKTERGAGCMFATNVEMV
jgi:hypothetical protein